MHEVLEEVYEPLEDGRIDADDLRDFVFTNPVQLWTSANPAFFAGTVVEDAAAAVNGSEPSRSSGQTVAQSDPRREPTDDL